MRARPPATPSEASGSQEPEALVSEFYQLLLGRPADDEGLKAYAHQLRSGLMTAPDFIRALVASDEFSARMRKKAEPPARPSIEDARTAATAALSAILSRAPSETERDSLVEPLASGASAFDVLRRLAELARGGRGDKSQGRKRASQQAAEIVRALFRREASEAEVARLAPEIEAGESPIKLLQTLTDSPEYARDVFRTPAVARRVTEALFSGLMKRLPDEGVLGAYAAALTHGYAFEAFVNELRDSPEFAGLGVNKRVPSEVARLLEGFIAARMVAEGCTLVTPPVNDAHNSTASIDQVNSLVRTLAMMSGPTTEAA